MPKNGLQEREKTASNVQIQVRLEGGVRRSNDNVEFPSTLALDVGQLFADDTVLHPKYIDATHVPRISGLIHPVVPPAHNAADTQAKNLLDLDMGLGRLGEKILPKLSYGFLPRVHGAVRGGIRVFEDTIVAHQLHHSGDIMTVEGLVERNDDAHA
jgi:hypothetical protein